MKIGKMTGTNSGRRVGSKARKARKIIPGTCEEETDEQVMNVEEWIVPKEQNPGFCLPGRFPRRQLESGKTETDKTTDSLTKISSVLSLV